MYSIIISFALAIYTIILLEASFLYKEISTQTDLLTSAQAYYSAEGVIEKTVATIGDQDLTEVNLAFLREGKNVDHEVDENFLDYGQGIDSSYIGRTMRVDQPFLHQVQLVNKPKTSLYNNSFTHTLANDLFSYLALEPKAAKGFFIREVPADKNFNELRFDFDRNSEDEELLVDVFIFPKQGQSINFHNFEELKNDPALNSIKRFSINTKNASSFFNAEDGMLTFHLQAGKYGFQKSLSISGFQPLQNNYFFHFQTLKNQPIHFQLIASYQNKPVVLPGLMQSIEVVGSTPTGLYQRVRFQREAEEGIGPGLNFVHFSDGDIVK